MSVTLGASLFSLGVALLLLAYRLHRTGVLRHYAVFQKHPPLLELAVGFIVFWGLGFVVTTGAVVIAQNKGAVFTLLGAAQQGQGDSGLSTTIGVLGIIMALVTAIVFSVSKDAINRLEKEKERMAERYRGIEAEASELRLLNVRLYAYQENELELKNARLNSDQGDLGFRVFLSSMYRQSESERLLDLLHELERKLNGNSELKLLPIDKGYLGKVRDHYRTYPAAENATEISKTAERILLRR